MSFPSPRRPARMTPERHQQLLAILARIGLDPRAAGGPGIDPTALAPVDEALCHSSAGLAQNHERLEFLGDAVLRLAAAEYLQSLSPRLSVGRCSAVRAQLVSDRWLAELAGRCELAGVLRLGPMADHDQAGRATVLAECCEALVGAIYGLWGGDQGGLAAVHRWLDPHWQRETADLLADPHRHNWKSALQEWSQGQGLGLPRYQCEERSRRHGDPLRFYCAVWLAMPEAARGAPPANPRPDSCWGEGWGGSRREAQQQAARQALEQLNIQPDPTPTRRRR
ncbi:MAG: ribonuclease III domain-containing protein [Synechococcaceae cyanobacterium]|nr:ribonuclease III domain-containing protein [Synechococcaceae cyanobacterium]